MARDFQPGDDLLFQLESGYGLLRVLAVDDDGDSGPVWHLLAYQNLFIDSETAENSLNEPSQMMVSIPHMALTNRAFERTPTARLMNRPVTAEEIQLVDQWRSGETQNISDRSALLMLGLR